MKLVGSRVGLLVALVPLVLACVPLVTFLPSDGSRKHWIDKISQQAVFEFVSYRARSNSLPRARVLSLDLNSGELKQLPIDEYSLAESYHFGDGNLHWQSYPDGAAMFGTSHRPSKSNSRRCVLTTFDLRTGLIARRATLEDVGTFPVSERVQILITKSRVSVLDLNSADADLYDLKDVIDALDAAMIPGTNRFLLVDPTYVFDDRNSKTNRIALYELNLNKNARRIADWPIGQLGRETFWSFLANGSEIASLSPDRQQIEVHSSVDGALLRRETMPAGLSGSLGRSELLSSRIIQTGLNSRRAFDIDRGDWLPSPSGLHWIEDESIESGLLLYRDDSKFEDYTVLDRATQRVLSRFTTDYGSEVRFLDARRIAVMSFHYGVMVRVIDSSSGKTLSVYRPFFWIVPTLIAVLAGYALWSTAWMVVSARTGVSVLWDILVVAGIPLVILIARIEFGGPLDELRRMPLKLVHGIAMAGAMLLTTWIVFGERRISLRVLALMAYCTLLLLGMAAAFPHETTLAWLGIATVIAPAVVFTLPLSLLHAFGWRVKQDAAGIAKHSSERRIDVGTKFHLRDLFAGTFIVAVLFTVSRSIHDTIGSLVEINYIQWPMLAAQLGSIAVLFTALRRRPKWVFPLAIVLILAAVAYLGRLSIVSLASSGQTLSLATGISPWHSLLACSVTMFVALVPLRLRGWTLQNSTDSHFLRRNPVSRSNPSGVSVSASPK